ncbi:MAG: CD225/dispanin family protein [Tannerella sp.]|jgi:uncharacterized membrane protein YvbJ|nr:CD225/dispanin family protein [Tannerella sp.]
MICSKCGANNIEGQTFCGSCGNPLESGISTPSEPQDNYQTAEKTYNADVSNAYTAPPGGPSNGGMVKPKSYLTESIIVTVVSILCCGSLVSLILGIIAILKASKVDNDFNTGNVSEAIQNSESAKKLTLWAAIIAVVWVIIGTILWFVGVGALFAGGELEEILQQYQ